MKSYVTKFTINKQRFFMGNHTQTLTSSQVSCIVVYSIFWLFCVTSTGHQGGAMILFTSHSLQMADKQMIFFLYFYIFFIFYK